MVSSQNAIPLHRIIPWCRCRSITGLSFHPIEPWLIVSSFDGALLVVNNHTGDTIAELAPSLPKHRQLSQASMGVSFSDDGCWLAAAKMTEGIY
ncbi:MAG: WD40 repeat protein [Mariniblastus sp.]|jgi:WD40 repeat protein